jgi:beta-N-acetylhexosaminidase
MTITKIGIGITLILISCTSGVTKESTASVFQDKEIQIDTLLKSPYSLSSYLEKNVKLDEKVDSVFTQLTNHDRISQLIMPAIGRLGENEDSIRSYVERKLIGGMLLLNGTKDQFKKWVTEFERTNVSRDALPFLYSADAEPSLVNRKIIGSKKVLKANALTSEEKVQEAARTISSDLNDIGINYNFAPVVDMSSNKTVGYRGFGSNPENILPFSKAFIKVMQGVNVIATAKHFPGHGLVSGDTHESLQVINGPLRELKYYPPLIADGVLSIMIAHIAVKNNKEFETNGMPATTSREIVTGLLRDSLNFQGLVVTDAMNMGGVKKVKNASVLATAAGCDILLMPLDVTSSHRKMLNEYRTNETYSKTVNQSVKRIIRMKICLGLIQ